MNDRIWMVSINLDSVAADMDAFPTDAEQAAWFRGFRIGARGLPAREGQSEAWLAGHRHGNEAHAKVVAHRERQSQKGIASAAARTTGRQPKVNHGSTTVQPDPNHCSTGPQPDPNLNEKRETRDREIEETRIERARDETPFDASPAEPIPDSGRWTYVQAEPWAKDLLAAGGKIGPRNWPQWKTLVTKHGLPAVIGALPGIDPEHRWPDRTEKAITQSRGQVSTSAAIAHKVRKLV